MSELKKALETIEALKKELETKIKEIDELKKRVAEIEKLKKMFDLKMKAYNVLWKYKIKKLEAKMRKLDATSSPSLRKRRSILAKHELLARPVVTKSIIARKLDKRSVITPVRKPEPIDVKKKEEIKKKLEELRKKYAEKRASVVRTPRPETVAMSKEDVEKGGSEIADVIKNILSGKMTTSQLPPELRKFHVEVKTEEGEKK